MSTADDLDDPYIARYAERVREADEVLWRADYARMVDLRERAYDEDAALLGQADAIAARWSADPEHGPLWTELDEIHSAWIHAPEAMARAHEVYMPGGLRPPGMDQPRWTSHMQAREMTGHGYWPGHEPTQSLSSERHEPMTDTTDHTPTAAEIAPESDAEKLFRYDYACYMAAVTSRDPGDHDPADDLDRTEYMSTWMDHAEDRWADEWLTLSQAHAAYERSIDEADAWRAQHGDTLSPVAARSWDQARDIVMSGRTAHGLLDSDYVTRLSYTQAEQIRAAQPDRYSVREVGGQEPALRPEPAQQPAIDSGSNHAAITLPSAGSALAGYRAGAALATAVEREVDGMQR